VNHVADPEADCFLRLVIHDQIPPGIWVFGNSAVLFDERDKAESVPGRAPPEALTLFFPMFPGADDAFSCLLKAYGERTDAVFFLLARDNRHTHSGLHLLSWQDHERPIIV
jgi:hypothetical protein